MELIFLLGEMVSQHINKKMLHQIVKNTVEKHKLKYKDTEELGCWSGKPF